MGTAELPPEAGDTSFPLWTRPTILNTSMRIGRTKSVDGSARLQLRHKLVTIVLALVLVGLMYIGRLVTWRSQNWSLAGGWESKVRLRAESPDGSAVASVLDWNGGATTGLETEIVLESLPATGVATNGDRVLLLRGRPDVSLRWIDPKILQIRVPLDQVEEKTGTWRGVDIRVLAAVPN